MKRLKARGRRGSWFAEVEGEQIPCAGMHRMKGLLFNNPEFFPGDKRRDELVDALRSGRRVILAEYDVTGIKAPKFTLSDEGGALLPGGPIRERKLYRCIYEIDDVEFDERGLRFRCTTRIAELED